MKYLGVAFIVSIMLSSGLWIKSMIDYDIDVTEIIKNNVYQNDMRDSSLIAVVDSIDRLNPKIQSVKGQSKQKKKDDIIDDYIDMKISGIL